MNAVKRVNGGQTDGRTDADNCLASTDTNPIFQSHTALADLSDRVTVSVPHYAAV